MKKSVRRPSKLIDHIAKGERFIAKAGKPLVKVTSPEAPTAAQIRRLGFMPARIPVPHDFDEMGRAEIEKLFGGED
jgi:antitoxin (DNA-binding transcriptional repressor) of toxin-antitoxin stability system